MQPEVYKEIEQINVEVIYDGLLVSLARSDYTFLFSLLQNFSEKPSDSSDLPSLDPPKLEQKNEQKSGASSQGTNLENLVENIAPLNDGSDSGGKSVPNTVVNVFIQSIKMHLHNDAVDDQRSVRLLLR
jgi:hypothetical protein